VMRDGIVEQIGTPEEVYLTPASPWVARFVGEAELLEAELFGAHAATEVGSLPTVATSPGPGTVMVRPEQLGLTPGGDAIVDVVSYFGRDTRYEVVLGSGTRLAVRAAGPPEHAVGERTGLCFTAARAQAWPAAARADQVTVSSRTMPSSNSLRPAEPDGAAWLPNST
jgi:iron(III) transport system ATP-binding protein